MNQRRNSEPAAFPGPWKLSGDESAIVDGNGERILTINAGWGGADLDYWPRALAVILAAPDLLKLAEALVQSWEACADGCDAVRHNDGEVINVRALIARAKGTP